MVRYKKYIATWKNGLEDGNSENNKEENLRLLCPNCHALTPTFKNLNKGNGRAWRLKNSKPSQSLAK